MFQFGCIRIVTPLEIQTSVFNINMELVITLFLSVVLAEFPLFVNMAEIIHNDNNNTNNWIQTDVDKMSLDQLKTECFPSKDSQFGRKDVKYVSMFADEVDAFLNHNRNLTKLHISIKGANPDFRDKNTLVLTQLQNSQIEELWIVPSENIQDSIQVSYFKVTFVYRKRRPRLPLLLKKLYIHLVLRTPQELLTLLESTRYLNVLSLVNIQSLTVDASLGKIIAVLKGQPISILRLDNYQMNDQFYESRVNTTQLFLPLQDSQIQCLTLRKNGLRYITPGITAVLPNIMILDLSYNHIFNTVNEGLLVELVALSKSLEMVDLSTQGDFQEARHHRHKRRDHHSIIPMIGDLAKECLDSLHTNFIEAARNRTVWCRTIQCLNISYLDGIPCSSLPSLLELSGLFDKSCYPPIRLPLSPNLKEIYFDYLSPLMTVTNNHFEEPLPACVAENQVTTISMSNDAILFKKFYFQKMVATFYVKGMTKLSMLDMSFGQLSVALYDSAFLRSFPALQKLYLQGNFLNLEVDSLWNTSLTEKQSLCSMLFPKLQEIDFSDANISIIPTGIFHNCSEIAKINLARNKIQDIYLDINSTSPVDNLNLSYNQIRTLNKSMRHTLVHLSNKHGFVIDLSENHLLCDCTDDAYETIQLIQTCEQNNLTFYQRETYRCIFKDNPDQVLLDVDLSELKSQCQPSYYKMIAYVSVSLLLLILLLIAVYLLHKYRYHIYTWYYRCQSNRNHNKRRMQKKYKYDAFISYCMEDRFWVHDVLMTTLQNKYGFKLVIHLRDFLVGEDIDNEIVRHMSLSRTNVIIMSDNSVKKQWPEFELKRAYTESHIDKKPLIIVKFGRIKTPKEDLSGLVQQILDSKVYNEWPEFSEDSGKKLNATSVTRRQELFWEKLAQAIYGNSSVLWGCGRCKHALEPSDFNDMLLNDVEYEDL